jgi:hypothetical protein
MHSLKFTVVGLMLVVIVFAAAAFTPPNGKPTGVQSDGTYWLAKSIADAVEAGVPSLKSMADNWKVLRKMALDNTGKYYIVKGKPCRAGFSMDYCFDIGANRFIPHALAQIENQSLLDGINPGEIVQNGCTPPGYNFHEIVVAAPN